MVSFSSKMDEASVIEFFNEKYESLKSRITGNYTFKFNNNLTRAGVCKFALDGHDGVIEMSRHYLNHHLTTPDKVKNTILHELAHAIAGHEVGHGPKWKSVAAEIGCDAQRLTHVFRPENSYKFCLKCPLGCKQNVTRLAKFMNRGRFCCKKHDEVITVYKRARDGTLIINN